MPIFEPNELILKDTYRIEKQIGQGAFGEVYLANYLKLGVQRAIKVVRRGDGVGSTNYEQYRDRFVLEAKLGASFHNTNVIHVNHFEEEDGRLFLIMDYAPGGSLADKIEESKDSGKSIPVDTAVKWVSEAAEGLSKLHERDMVHRDIKPSNILIDTEGHACIADLGLVQLPTSRVEGGSIGINHPGTAEYMPPEQQAGNYMPLRANADVYALGCVLFELLTGRQYYHQNIGTKVISLRKDTPIWLDAVIAIALRKDGDKRYKNAYEFCKALKRRKLDCWKLMVFVLIIGSIFTGLIWITKSFFKINANTTPSIVTVQDITLTPMKNNPITKTATAADEKIVIQGVTSTPTITPIKYVTPTSNKESLGIGSTIVSPIDGMIMVYVPEGDFLMGSLDGIGKENEHPQHAVYLSSYWIDKTEVTNAMYAKCLNAKACSLPPSKSSFAMDYVNNRFIDPNYSNHPVMYTTWEMANSYCKWVGRKIPSEAEWEKAAKGTDSFTYPWGETRPNCNIANFSGCNRDSVPVGSFLQGASPYGVLDMAGNASEWVLDYYSDSYYSESIYENPLGPENGEFRVIRGGSYFDNDGIRTSKRSKYYPSSWDGFEGFRCAMLAN